jgi:hypothetical protein
MMSGDSIVFKREGTGAPIAEVDGGFATMIGGRPDFVKSPQSGARINVIDDMQGAFTCPTCKTEDMMPGYELEENPEGIQFVLMCPKGHYLWLGKEPSSA